jgi:ribonuclease VapC
VIVDTSAIVAILRGEPEAEEFITALADADRTKMSAATYVEASVVVDANRDPVLSARFDELVTDVEVVPLTRAHAEVARRAYQDYGMSSGHPARLNLGDCFSYALARVCAEPLLFKGDDFAPTDLTPARTTDN